MKRDKDSPRSTIEKAMGRLSLNVYGNNTNANFRQRTLSDESDSRPLGAEDIKKPVNSQKVAIGEKLDSLNMLTVEKGRSLASEEYRRIKRPLLNNISGNGDKHIDRANIIMVTSALHGEGKTYTSTSLAMSMAMERDKTVLLIDADVAKSSISKLLGLNVEHGLADYLAGEVSSLSDVILNTEVENLKILPAGTPHPNVTELFSSQSMQVLVNELSKRYPDRIVIFDTPPLLLTNEAAILAGQVGQIVVVVSAGATTEKDLSEALALLGSHDSIGFVLNKCQQPSGAGYYGYGY